MSATAVGRPNQASRLAASATIIPTLPPSRRQAPCSRYSRHASASSEPADINELFTITIPGRSEPLTFRAQGKVVAAASSSGT